MSALRTSSIVAAIPVGVLLFTGTSPSLPSAQAADRDCGDFDNRKQAQGFFENAGPGDPHGLDDDSDGQACESLPCPCPGSGAQKPGGGKKPAKKPKPPKRSGKKRFGEAKPRGGPIYANTQCGRRSGLKVQPTEIQISCGSSAYRGFNLVWSLWDRDGATASGTIYSRDCRFAPSTAECTTSRNDPGYVSLYRPRFCRFIKKNVWTRVSITWDPTVPHETSPVVLQSNCSFFEPVRFAAGQAQPSDHASKRAAAVAAGCGTIRLGGETRIFSRSGIPCQRAKKWAHRVYKTRGKWEPDGFECESGSGFKQGGSCFNSSGTKLLAWHPAD